MLFTILSRLHSLSLIFVLVFLGAAIMGAARTNFIPNTSRYPSSKVSNKQAGASFILSVFTQPKGKRILLLDSASTDPKIISTVPQKHVELLTEGLSKKGVTVIHSYGMPLEKIVGNFDAAVLIYPCDNYINIDFEALSTKLDDKVLFDYCAAWDSSKADAAGLMHLNFARTYWPHWLDPDLHKFIEHLRITTKQGDGILLIPSEALATTAARARWFLALNYYSAPRRFYLYRPQDGTSFLTKYFKWVMDYSAMRPHRGQTKIRNYPRTLSRLNSVNAPRTLNEEELRAASNHNVQWVLFWRHQADFKICDFELVDIETVRGWK